MTVSRVFIATAVAAGIGSVWFLPPEWLGPLASVVGICAAISLVMVRLGVKTKPPSSRLAGILLSLANLPEEPSAKINESWKLTTFLALAAFLVAMALSVMVRAGGWFSN